MAVAASPTRALGLGGGNPSSFFDYIDYVEIATTGNAQDFGDLTQDRNQNTAVSSNTRAICIGGNRTPAISNVMDYVTIATTGNATDFGDTVTPYEHTGSVDNAIRGVITGARTPTYLNILNPSLSQPQETQKILVIYQEIILLTLQEHLTVMEVLNKYE